MRARVQNARDPNAPSEIRRPYKKIDELLRSDNAVGKLRRGKSNVVVFPGRKAATNPRMGPFTEQSTLDGRIVRVGGTDATAHALIEDGDGTILSAECTRELAIELAQYLYKQPVRLVGNARWVRTEVGDWELLSFRAKEFVPITPGDLASAIGKIREIDADWKKETDPAALLRRLRGENDEVH